MDRLSVIHQKSPKRAKSKRKPIKVVYISSPMKVQATISQFKGIVQELTGQDSDVADLPGFADLDRVQEQQPAATGRGSRLTADGYFGATELGGVDQEQWRHRQQYNLSDEVFTPPVLESLAALVPSSLHYEFPPQGESVYGLSRFN
uniref:Protein MKS1 n=1 Tax=Anthurium amnicola TaxID=1678845 RepID=A0A1D1YB40_9ARAE